MMRTFDNRGDWYDYQKYDRHTRFHPWGLIHWWVAIVATVIGLCALFL